MHRRFWKHALPIATLIFAGFCAVGLYLTVASVPRYRAEAVIAVHPPGQPRQAPRWPLIQRLGESEFFAEKVVREMSPAQLEALRAKYPQAPGARAVIRANLLVRPYEVPGLPRASVSYTDPEAVAAARIANLAAQTFGEVARTEELPLSVTVLELAEPPAEPLHASRLWNLLVIPAVGLAAGLVIGSAVALFIGAPKNGDRTGGS